MFDSRLSSRVFGVEALGGFFKPRLVDGVTLSTQVVFMLLCRCEIAELFRVDPPLQLFGLCEAAGRRQGLQGGRGG
jgi:hypothetical protein